MEFINVGKIVNTHGIKGEVRLLSKFKHKDKVFTNGAKIYIGNEKKEEIINSYRIHKCFDMLKFNNISNINDVISYKNKHIYINKASLKLNENEYLNEELIGIDAYYEDELLGKIILIDSNGAQDVFIIDSTKRILIPYVNIFIESIYPNNKVVFKNLEGLL